MKFPFGGSSLWDPIRLQNISTDDVIDFWHNYDTLVSNEDVVNTLTIVR